MVCLTYPLLSSFVLSEFFVANLCRIPTGLESCMNWTSNRLDVLRGALVNEHNAVVVVVILVEQQSGRRERNADIEMRASVLKVLTLGDRVHAETPFTHYLVDVSRVTDLVILVELCKYYRCLPECNEIEIRPLYLCVTI